MSALVALGALAVLAAAAADAVALVLALAGRVDATTGLLYHLAIAAIATLVTAPLGVARHRGYPLLAFAFAAALPVLGAPGLYAITALGLRGARPRRKAAWELVEVELEDVPEPATTKPRTSPARLAAILANRAPETAERRFRAVLATSAFPLRQAIAILKTALRDPSDEVRLFAFSRIERARQEVESSIGELERRLAHCAHKARGGVELRLSEAHFRLCDLRLAEGAVREAALDRAHEHAAAAVAAMPESAPARFHLGRVLLEKREWAAALVAFGEAVRGGYPASQVLPLRAECAFRLRRYELALALLSDLGAAGQASPWRTSIIIQHGTCLQNVVQPGDVDFALEEAT